MKIRLRKPKKRRQSHPRTEKGAEWETGPPPRSACEQQQKRPSPSGQNRVRKGKTDRLFSQEKSAGCHQLHISTSECPRPEQTDHQKGQADRNTSLQPGAQRWSTGKKQTAYRSGSLPLFRSVRPAACMTPKKAAKSNSSQKLPLWASRDRTAAARAVIYAVNTVSFIRKRITSPLFCLLLQRRKMCLHKKIRIFL